jgi:hypothetical protein
MLKAIIDLNKNFKKQGFTLKNYMDTKYLAIENWEAFLDEGGIERYIKDEEVTEYINESQFGSSQDLVGQDFFSKNIVDYNLKSTNLFMYHISNQSICKKCGNSATVIIKRNKSKKSSNIEESLFLPLPVMDSLIPYMKYLHYNTALKINIKTDWWYCPICDELHGFDYSEENGLEFDQGVIDLSDK